jgi:hypothetical protein
MKSLIACHLERSAIKTLIHYKLTGAESKDPENIQDIFAASGSSLQTVSCERPDAAWQCMQYRDLSTTRPSTHLRQYFSTRCAQDDRCVLRFRDSLCRRLMLPVEFIGSMRYCRGQQFWSTPGPVGVKKIKAN